MISVASLVGQLNVSATMDLSFEGGNLIEEQFLQYNENGKLIYSLNVSVLINRVIMRVYRMSDKETEAWMGEQIRVQYKWSIIVQSIVCFKGLGKISLDIDQTGASVQRAMNCRFTVGKHSLRKELKRLKATKMHWSRSS